MKTLTLHQPWATLVALGIKQWETRSWSTPYRGQIAIHAAKGWSAADRALVHDDQFFGLALALAGITAAEQLPLGAIVAVADLVSVDFTGRTEVRSGSILLQRQTWPAAWIADLPDDERHFGNYGPRRYGWKLANVHRLPEPIPARGALGLWEWNDTWPFGDDAALCLKCGHYTVRGHQVDGFGECAWCDEPGLVRHEISA